MRGQLWGGAAMTKLEITIPVLDEESTLKRQVHLIDAYLREHFDAAYDTKIVIGDNGSSDGTEEIGRALARELERVRYVNVGRRGVGLALKTCWGNSDADIVGYMDLDLATDLKHLDEAVSLLVADEADLVVGSRLAPGARVIGRTMKRAFVSRVFNRMLKLYLGVKFSDGMCGFKFLQRRHLNQLMTLGAQSDGWFFSAELLACAEHSDLRLNELPIVWTDDPDTKAKIGPLAIEYIQAMRTLKQSLRVAS